MPQNSIQSLLRETFLSPDKEVWKQFASQELEGKNPDEVLSWNTESGVSFQAYYDSSDEKRNPLSNKFRVTVADDPFFGPAKWLNAPFVSVTSETVANETALQHLTNGADAIFFSCPQQVNLEYLLNGIDWRYCSLFFEIGEQRNFVHELKSFILKNFAPDDSLSGGLFWETVPKIENSEDSNLSGLKNFLTVKSSTSVHEISEALLAGVRLVEQANTPTLAVFKSIGFSVSAGTSFLETIAKIRALRFLWFQVAHAYGHSAFAPGDLHIHARSEKWINEKFQPHGNLLKSTLASMAAVIGGANAITIFPEDPSHTMMNRIARNVSNLLREESHLDKVADPSAGAYAIDAMTEEFAKHAWKTFQEKQAK
ncbi:MAG TPA: methylmalonyl-CoA mutase family protein [Chryseosolibacter sp.]